MASKRPRKHAAPCARPPPQTSIHEAQYSRVADEAWGHCQTDQEEREKLLHEAAILEQQLESLRMQAGLPLREERAAMADAKAQGVELQELALANTLEIGRVHSLVTQRLLSPPVALNSTYIHLPRDMDERCAILRSLKHVTLQRAERFIDNHFYYIDPCMEYLKEERFTDADGLFHCDRYEINQFPNFQTAQQLHDALLYYLSNMEISITETIGQLTLREDTSDNEPTIWNHRLVTTAADVGCTEELNLVGFAHFYRTHGVIAYETVDEDDLYPYRPLERTRKDSQVMHVVCEAFDQETNRKVVLLKSCTRLKELPVGFQLPPSIERNLHEHSMRWPRLIVEYLHEYKVPHEAPSARVF